MKKLSFALSLLLILFAGGVWAEDDEFPIELTCEIGHSVINIRIANNAKDSWWELNTISNDISKYEKRMNFLLNKKQFRNKKNEITYQDVKENKIILSIGRGINGMNLAINRHTGKITGYSVFSIEGDCFAGFKVYKDREF